MVRMALAGASLAVLAGCLPGPGPGIPRPVYGVRVDAPTARLVSFRGPGTVRVDSLEVTVTWTAPALPDAGQYGPVQSWRVCALGGATSPPAGPGEPSAARCVTVPGPATVAVIRLPWTLAGLGPTGVTDQWTVRGCVQSVRWGVAGPDVCRDVTFPVTYPAPLGAENVEVTAIIRQFPEG